MPAHAAKTSTWVVVILTVLALALTNPSEQEHRVKIVRAAQQGAANDGLWGALMVVSGATDAAVDLIPFEYHNYLIFSTVTCNGDRVSVGLLGNVILSDSAPNR